MHRTLTMRASTNLDKIEKRLNQLVSKETLMNKARELKNKERTSARPSVLQQLYSLFDKIDVPYTPNQLADYYINMIRRIPEEKFQDQKELMIELLQENLNDFPTPKTYLERVINFLEDPEDGWHNDPLRLRLLKQFYKYAGGLHPLGCGGLEVIKRYIQKKNGNVFPQDVDEQVRLIQDDIFDCLQNATKDQRKLAGCYGLLYICENLAGGQFSSNGGTRRDLYFLAIAYGVPIVINNYHIQIHVDPDTREEKPNFTLVGLSDCADSFTPELSVGAAAEKVSSQIPIISLEKNLFHEYYQNNLVRFLESDLQKTLEQGSLEVRNGQPQLVRQERRNFEREPTGYGINYGNYVEVIYLYAQVRDIPVPEKISLINRMITECRRRTSEARKNLVQGTHVYRSYFEPLTDPFKLGLNEKGFVNYLVQNFDLVDRKGRGPFPHHDENRTAQAMYNFMMSLIVESYEEDTQSFDSAFLMEIKPKSLSQDSLSNPDTLRLNSVIQEMNKFLSRKLPERWEENKPIPRTSLMSLFHHLYNTCVCIYEEDPFEYGLVEMESEFDLTFNNDPDYYPLDSSGNFIRPLTIDRVLADYKAYLNPILKKGGFQLIDPKNFFDMALIFSSYCCCMSE